MTEDHQPIQSLTEFIGRVFDIRKKWTAEDQEHDEKCDTERSPTQLWFRGLPSVKHELVPGFYRLEDPDEEEIWSGFKRQGFLQLVPDIRLPQNDVEWYFLMQHHGAPTRLLDWTDGALLGLYFALRNHPHINKELCQHEINDAAMWVLDPVWLNRKSMQNGYTEGVLLYDWPEIEPWFPKPFLETLHVKNPIAIDPPHVARRVAVQHSRFTVHGTDKNGIETVAAENPGDCRLEKIPIAKDKIPSISADLATCGIVETTIFPDLEGLSRQLKREWSKH
jgi:hypothetical protein